MRIVLAFDSFKGSLTAAEACSIAAETLLALLPAAKVQSVPMADGGEGTAEALVTAAGGCLVPVSGVAGPLPGQRLTAAYGWLPNTRTAVVEMARASGLPLVPEPLRNPLRTTTLGTGELIEHALRHGALRLLLTLGGSATVDGGTGAASARGWHFFDRHGKPVRPGGEGLCHIARIAPPDAPPRTAQVEALCDVNSPLLGRRGAAAVYGPQKGATPEMVLRLEEGLANLARCILESLGTDVAALPGAGAAGGLGAGAVAFFGASLVPGAVAVARTAGLPEALRAADWVVTGEGCLDAQSLQGKVLTEVLRLAGRAGCRVAVVSGRVLLDAAQCLAAGIAECEACAPDATDIATAMENAPRLLARACGRLAPRLASPHAPPRITP
ncbi:MAG: glycerate kinase [Lentisphaeria bacterium]|nr:glycerate kinase [Lentisphaeria bacterium]